MRWLVPYWASEISSLPLSKPRRNDLRSFASVHKGNIGHPVGIHIEPRGSGEGFYRLDRESDAGIFFVLFLTDLFGRGYVSAMAVNHYRLLDLHLRSLAAPLLTLSRNGPSLQHNQFVARTGNISTNSLPASGCAERQDVHEKLYQTFTETPRCPVPESRFRDSRPRGTGVPDFEIHITFGSELSDAETLRAELTVTRRATSLSSLHSNPARILTRLLRQSS